MEDNFDYQAYLKNNPLLKESQEDIDKKMLEFLKQIKERNIELGKLMRESGYDV